MFFKHITSGIADHLRATRIIAPIIIGRAEVRCVNGRMVKHVMRRAPWWIRLRNDWRAAA